MNFDLSFRRKVIILSGILGVLVITYVLGIVFSPESIHRRAAEEPLIPILQKESIREISLINPDDSVRLKKDGQHWTVLISGVSFPAQSTRIESMLDLVASLKKARVVGSGQDSWESFEVGPTRSRRIQFTDGAGKSLLDLHVGKSGVGTGGSFVRLESAQEVVQVDRSLEYYVGSGTDIWSDLRFFPKDLQGSDLIRIGIRSRVRFDAEGMETAQPIHTTLFLDNTPQGPVWRLDGDAVSSLSSRKVERLANTLAAFQGTRFVADLPADQAGFDQPLAELVLTTARDAQYRVLVGRSHPQEPDQYYVKLDGQTFSYLAPAWRIHEILQDPKALLEDPDE